MLEDRLIPKKIPEFLIIITDTKLSIKNSGKFSEPKVIM